VRVVIEGGEYTRFALDIDFCGVGAVEGEFLPARRIIVGISEMAGIQYTKYTSIANLAYSTINITKTITPTDTVPYTLGTRLLKKYDLAQVMYTENNSIDPKIQ